MDIWLFLQAIIMGIIEGITEFLPISSTGHLIVAGEMMDFWTLEKRNTFAVVIQMGAIAAVIYEYWHKLWGAFWGALRREPEGLRLAIGLLAASIPIVIVGFTIGSWVKEALFNNVTVAIGLIVGGLIILWVEKHPQPITAQEIEQISIKQSIQIGLLQCLSLIPGTSRAGATIVGGMVVGLSRKNATEFSFFLGIPVIIGAALLDLYESRGVLQSQQDLAVLAVGTLVSFVSALILIRVLVRYVAKHDLSVFAWYRIISGVVILVFVWTGWTLW
ncbi:MAG: undecaprenyl-diphosphate phosphatase [Pseudomonadota bacterium]|nr:undecaprenyl-diphosphate phosphatase [Pseudomonadota bacterium]